VPAAPTQAGAAVLEGAIAACTGRAHGSCSLLVPGREGLDGVHRARASLAGLVGLDADRLVFAEQVHAGEAAVVDASDAGRGLRSPHDAVPGVDALVTADPSVALVVLTADCVPVLLSVPGGGVAAAHAGRAGVAAGVVPAAVATLLGVTGADAADVRALVGPAVGGCCYEVPARLRAAVADRTPEAHAATRWGTPSLDLPAAVAAQLRDCGVTAVDRSAWACTVCDPDLWFSHRATTADGAPAGRQATVVRMAAAPPEGGPTGSLHSG
jgi:polyphenol oxidase